MRSRNKKHTHMHAYIYISYIYIIKTHTRTHTHIHTHPPTHPHTHTHTHTHMYICFYIHAMKKPSVHHLHHVPKCFSCHKAILMMTARPHCFHDYICGMRLLLLQDITPFSHMHPLLSTTNHLGIRPYMILQFYLIV